MHRPFAPVHWYIQWRGMPNLWREIPWCTALARGRLGGWWPLSVYRAIQELEVKHLPIFLCCFFQSCLLFLFFHWNIILHTLTSQCQEQCLRCKDENSQGGHLKSQRHRLHFRSGASFWILLFVRFLKQATTAADSTCFTLYIFNVCSLLRMGREILNSLSVSVMFNT